MVETDLDCNRLYSPGWLIRAYLFRFFSYFEYKTIIYNKESDTYYFPDVTVCDDNAINFSNLKKVAETNDDVKCLYDVVTNSTNVNKSACILNHIPRLNDVYSALAKNVSYRVGHSLKDMILECEH